MLIGHNDWKLNTRFETRSLQVLKTLARGNRQTGTGVGRHKFKFCSPKIGVHRNHRQAERVQSKPVLEKCRPAVQPQHHPASGEVARRLVGGLQLPDLVQ